MNLVSHGLSSYYVVLILSQIFPYQYNTSVVMLLVYFLISFIPDMSGLWSGKLKHHHRGFLHAPLFWITLFIIGIILGLGKWAYLFLFIIILHLMTDFITARTTGIPLFYPFSKKEYSFKKMNHPKGDINPVKIFSRDFWSYAKYYFKDKRLIIFEAIMFIIGVISLYLIV